MRQALDLDFDIVVHAHHRTRPNRPRAPQAATLRGPVERLRVEEVCGEFHHPDQRLADQIEELAAPC
ncbi:hypothetical protein [Streptomyces sp. NRRL S-340]|uniref:hypothetical protein n=1 Tax=Streptomyces sp. NRRL S-340 TaxID=1463901 RepID=UPI000567FC48|nr:hypothetical protein [Streptomyces sp. NRRL S-340]